MGLIDKNNSHPMLKVDLILNIFKVNNLRMNLILDIPRNIRIRITNIINRKSILKMNLMNNLLK